MKYVFFLFTIQMSLIYNKKSKVQFITYLLYIIWLQLTTLHYLLNTLLNMQRTYVMTIQT